MRLVVSRSESSVQIGERCRQRGDVIEILEDHQDAGVLGETNTGWWIVDVPGVSPNSYSHLLQSGDDDDGANRVLQVDIDLLKSKLSEEDIAKLESTKRVTTSNAAITYAVKSR
jgi:nitrogen regulatory protein PII-like uncharacterized protein